MKVYLGKYLNYIGPYQIADKIFFWIEKYPNNEAVFERWDYKLHDQFGSWLAKTWIRDLCQWVQDHRRRTEIVKIDNYDVWGMDHTLALIIHPMLLKLKTQKHGYGWIDNKDVPKEIRSTAPGARKGITNKWDWDNFAEARYSWVLDEMIWTFAQLADDDTGESLFYDHTESNKEKDFAKSLGKLKVDRVGLELHQKRIENGLRLFGKYFRTLWD